MDSAVAPDAYDQLKATVPGLKGNLGGGPPAVSEAVVAWQPAAAQGTLDLSPDSEALTTA